MRNLKFIMGFLLFFTLSTIPSSFAQEEDDYADTGGGDVYQPGTKFFEEGRLVGCMCPVFGPCKCHFRNQ